MDRPGPLLHSDARGDVAQLEEHRVRIAGVRGSSPLISTIPTRPTRRMSGWVQVTRGAVTDTCGMSARSQDPGMNHAFGSPPSGPWDRVAPDVLPLLRRAHHPYPPDLAPLQVNVPPGVWTGFGVDLGPAMSHITRA